MRGAGAWPDSARSSAHHTHNGTGLETGPHPCGLLSGIMPPESLAGR